MRKIIICYVPVLHEGYRRFFEKYKTADLYILGQDLISKFDYLYKEIRALNPLQMKKALESLGIFKVVNILDEKLLKKFKKEKVEIIMPDEDIMQTLAKKYFPGKKIKFDDVFLRWDKHSITKEFPVSPDIKISKKEFDKQMMLRTNEESKKSSDWWRRVGAVIIKNEQIIISTCSQHVPSPQMPYVNGDPRSCAHKGVNLELSTAIHAEAAVIAEAAKLGISLDGTSIYITNFPCPPCAKLIAYSGIKKLYYNIGYGVLDGESILKQKGVEIIFVDMDLPKKKEFGTIPYKK